MFQFNPASWWDIAIFEWVDEHGERNGRGPANRIMFPLVEGLYPVEYDENFNDGHFEECRDDVALHAYGDGNAYGNGYMGTMFVCKDSTTPEDLKKVKERLRKEHMAKLAKRGMSLAK